MSGYCVGRRLPRAGIDPIDSEQAALSMVWALQSTPARHETIVLPLDDQRHGQRVIVVSGTVEPDSFHDVVEAVGWQCAVRDDVGAVVVASVRPGGGLDEGDVDRWLAASDLLDELGLELLEWFVIGAQVACPRDMLGEPPRWRR
jgi:hypothetical protein